MFYVGQKVTPIISEDGRSNWWNHAKMQYENGPVIGNVYTIRGFDSSEMGLLLHEFRTGSCYLDGTEAGYWKGRFRPVVEKKTDISFAHEILKKATKKQPEVV